MQDRDDFLNSIRLNAQVVQLIDMQTETSVRKFTFTKSTLLAVVGMIFACFGGIFWYHVSRMDIMRQEMAIAKEQAHSEEEKILSKIDSLEDKFISIDKNLAIMGSIFKTIKLENKQPALWQK